jgi:acetoin utilization protein AcuB
MSLGSWSERSVGPKQREEVTVPAGTVMQVMTTPVWTLQSTDTLRKAVTLMRNRHIRHAPVLAGDRLVGMLSDRDVRAYLPPPSHGRSEANGSILDQARVREMMTEEPISIGPYHRVTAAASVMLDRHIGALPVVEEGRVIGIVTQTDVLRALLDLLEGEAQAVTQPQL